MAIVELTDIKCPKCGKNLSTEENIEDLCSEPFNGVCVECDCGAEVSLNLKVEVDDISEGGD